MGPFHLISEPQGNAKANENHQENFKGDKTAQGL